MADEHNEQKEGDGGENGVNQHHRVVLHLIGVVFPYALASVSVFYALYLVHYPLNVNASSSPVSILEP